MDRGRRGWVLATLALFALLALPECRAQEPPPRTPKSAYWWASAGNFDGNDNHEQLDDERGQYAIAGGIGIQIRPAFAVDIELLLYGADYDAAPLPPMLFTQVSDQYEFTAPGLMGTARLALPHGPLRPYGGLGVGFFNAELSRSGSTFGFPGQITEDDFTFGLSASAGVDIAVGKKSFLMIEYRRLFVDADFDEATDGEVDVGGALVLLGYRRRF